VFIFFLFLIRFSSLVDYVHKVYILSLTFKAVGDKIGKKEHQKSSRSSGILERKPKRI